MELRRTQLQTDRRRRMSTLAIAAYPISSHHTMHGGTVVVCGTAIVAFVPDTHIANRITQLLNEHGLADTDDLETP
jgi:hypothetical protein